MNSGWTVAALTACWLLCFGLATTLSASIQDEEAVGPPPFLAVEVSAEGKGQDFDDTGIFDLKIKVLPLEDIDRAYAIRVRFVLGGEVLLHRDHLAPIPTLSWKKGSPQTWELSTSLPFDRFFGRSGRCQIRIGFVDAATQKVICARGQRADRNGCGLAGHLTLPTWERLASQEDVEELLARGQRLVKSGASLRARELAVSGIRRAIEDDDKRRFRDVIYDLANSRIRPRPMSVSEAKTVESRIAAEKNRYLRRLAGTFHDREQWHAALQILSDIGGRLEENAAEAVIGAVTAIQRSEKSRQDLRRKIRERITKTDREEAVRLADKLGRSSKLLKKAKSIEKKGRLELARALYKTLRFTDEPGDRDEAYRRLHAIDALLIGRTPAEETRLVESAVNHPAWARTKSRLTHHFILIGPKILIDNIPVESIEKFDLAYVFLSDLFGRISNPGGDRITVYFKELWEFSGGVAGGTTIDIGRADPKRKGHRVDNSLMYHELTHCIENMRPKYRGFTEGLANMGAIYCEEMISRRKPNAALFHSPLEAFRKSFLERDLEYWRIQQYDPSCGFFLHFLERYAKRKDGLHDWKTYRTFFREYRALPVLDGRDHQVVRAIAYYLVRVFGEEAFEDLRKFRFPLTADDRRAIALELLHAGVAVAGLDDEASDSPGDALQDHPNSYFRRDELGRLLMEMMRRPDPVDEIRAFAAEELGVLFDWNVIGPFRRAGVEADACVFPPEREIDLAAEYRSGSNLCRWRQPKDQKPLTAKAHGWVRIEYNYQDNSAMYAVTWVHADKTQDALLHLRGDDDLSAWIGPTLVGKYRNRGRNGSSWLWWRGPAATLPDAIVFPLQLKAGWNRLLLKIKNRRGPAGFAAALSAADGETISGLKFSAQSQSMPASDGKTTIADAKWKRALRYRFDSKSYRSKFEVTVGNYKVSRKRLEGRSRDGKVIWRPFTIKPGVKKDSPSNLLWIKEKYTRDLKDFALDLHLDAAAPKIVVTFMGEGGRDGLSGWNLILHPAGPGKVAARLERYDRLVYEAPPFKLQNVESSHHLRLELRDGICNVQLDAQMVFHRVAIKAIPGRHRVGMATWGPGTAFRSIKLSRSQEN
ncbi:MAG: hypothetical protein V3W41_09545 [Planctomycetota bacterium]